LNNWTSFAADADDGDAGEIQEVAAVLGCCCSRVAAFSTSTLSRYISFWVFVAFFKSFAF
jgi:hypothetical protein